MNRTRALAGVGGAAAQVGRLLGQTLLGALCGVGFVWTLTAVWPPSRSVVVRVSEQLGSLSSSYPVALVGLLLGALGTLAWLALRRTG